MGCALRNGKVWCWGANVYGALGLGNETAQVYPTRVTLPGLADEIGVGSDSTCARIADGVYCWGLNNQGQVGVGPPAFEGCSSACSLLPRQVIDSMSNPLTGIIDLNLAYHAGCALRIDNALLCWGAGTTNYASPLIMDALPQNDVALYTTVGTGNVQTALRVLTQENVLGRQSSVYDQACQ